MSKTCNSNISAKTGSRRVDIITVIITKMMVIMVFKIKLKKTEMVWTRKKGRKQFTE